MNHNTRLFQPALITVSAVLVGVTLAGCGGNAPAEKSAGTASTLSQSTTSQTTSQATTETTSPSAAPAELAAFFPGATLTKKAFPMDAEAAAHLSEMAKVKFTGDEKEWEVYEASQNGARVGYAMMTHLNASGGDTHVVFAVDKNFKITHADAMDAPALKPLVTQAVGKSHSAKWKIGGDLKPVSGLPAGDAQAAVDALHKGVLILEENFNPRHGEHGTPPGGTTGGASRGTAGTATGTGGTAGESASGHQDDGHNHDGHSH